MGKYFLLKNMQYSLLYTIKKASLIVMVFGICLGFFTLFKGLDNYTLLSLILYVGVYIVCGKISIIPIVVFTYLVYGSVLYCLVYSVAVLVASPLIYSVFTHLQYHLKRYKLRTTSKNTKVLQQYSNMLNYFFLTLNKDIQANKCENGAQEPIVVQQAIPKPLLGLLSGYILSKYRQDFYEESRDHQVPGSRAIYGDTLIESLLSSYCTVIEAYTGLELWPTYSTCRVYSKGQSLPKHHDRNSCEITVSICVNLDKSNVNEADYSWPIYIQSGSTNDSYNIHPGDALIYRGISNVHWRNKLTANRQVQILLHYVDKNGAFKNYKNDFRDGVGESELSILDYAKKEKLNQGI
ncbi:MAG: hypothetical protein HOL58_03455 [Francisellaceae bacterium]|jgi:hypothetical protein|nr:hypothetical protein [Francisellaceae bacterium]